MAVHSPVQPRPQIDTQILASKTNETEPITRQEIKAKIAEATQESHLRKEVLWNVARCESGFDQSARGNAGEIGLFQYLPSTFSYFKQKSGKHRLSIHSPSDQIELTVWAFKNGLQSHWTCYRKIY